jgi:hypothetical protein
MLLITDRPGFRTVLDIRPNPVANAIAARPISSIAYVAAHSSEKEP